MSLNIMVLEGEHGAATEAVEELTKAGHVVLRCHDPGAPAFPCRGIVDDSDCPLRSHVVDVALTVRSRVRSQPAPEEDGARCALMQHVPLVVAGPSVLDPYGELSTRTVDRTYDVVTICEEAAAAELVEHERRAAAVITGSIGPDYSPRVHVTRVGGGLRVRIDGLDGADSRQRQTAVVRVAGALRQFDHAARTIDVVVEDAPA